MARLAENRACGSCAAATTRFTSFFFPHHLTVCSCYVYCLVCILRLGFCAAAAVVVLVNGIRMQMHVYSFVYSYMYAQRAQES